jgi:Bacteriocin-protection, YdeI or OmpD-Associated/Domain of unknown function (DUF1905)
VPLDVREAFGRARPPVRVTLNEHTWRSTVAVYGGRFFLPLNRAVRDATGAKPGDTVEVELRLDTEPREVEVPPELAERLGDAADARAFYDGLSYTHRKEYADWVSEAKREETRLRRAKRAVEMLRESVESPR